MFRTEVARQFIGDAALPPNPPVDFGDESAEESVPFDAGAAPGAVVSSALIAWDEDTPTDIRQAVSDSLLFAQLFADKSVPDRNDVKQWMTNYFNVLPNIGWTLTSDVRDETEEDALGSEVHQRILDLIAIVLGPIPTALAVVTSALMSLQSMAADSPWITLFNRRSKRSHLGWLASQRGRSRFPGHSLYSWCGVSSRGRPDTHPSTVLQIYVESRETLQACYLNVY